MAYANIQLEGGNIHIGSDNIAIYHIEKKYDVLSFVFYKKEDGIIKHKYRLVREDRIVEIETNCLPLFQLKNYEVYLVLYLTNIGLEGIFKNRTKVFAHFLNIPDNEKVDDIGIGNEYYVKDGNLYRNDILKDFFNLRLE